MNLETYVESRASMVESALRDLLESGDGPDLIYQAVRYSLFAGGKRVRPVLCLASCEAVGGEPRDALPAACALEMVHTYSLIHDDLPCMDNDDLRRGRPTSHKVYGEATAVLAGDALLTKAFEVVASAGPVLGEETGNRIILELSRAAGMGGMIGGQALDILSEGKSISARELDEMHCRKTGALLRTSVRIGAIVGGCQEGELERLTEYADAVGLVFQITDDLLDVEGNETELGKAVGSDLKNRKSTYVTVLGLEHARAEASRLTLEAKAALESLGPRARLLGEFADYVANRRS